MDAQFQPIPVEDSIRFRMQKKKKFSHILLSFLGLWEFQKAQVKIK